MKQSTTLELSESTKVAEPFFMKDPGVSESKERVSSIPLISCYNDYVVILRDIMTSTIQLSASVHLPTGIVVGVTPDSKISIGDHVRFLDSMATIKEANYPGYDDGSLTVISEKWVLYKLP